MLNLVRLKTAAERVGVSVSMLYKLKYKGKLDFFYLGRLPYVKIEDVEALILSSTRLTEVAA